MRPVCGHSRRRAGQRMRKRWRAVRRSAGWGGGLRGREEIEKGVVGVSWNVDACVSAGVVQRCMVGQRADGVTIAYQSYSIGHPRLQLCEKRRIVES